MRTSYEYIVLGCGGIGSGAAYWLARRAGADVLGLEQFKLGHDHGGSQDHSRVIRRTYHNPIYSRLAPELYTTWGMVEEESGVTLKHITGSVGLWPIGEAYQASLTDHFHALEAAKVPYEYFDEAELMRRYPQFRVQEPLKVIYQTDTGLVDAGKANATHIALARAYGATILDQCPVQSLRPTTDGVELVTPAGTFHCRKLVVTAGAWTAQLLNQVGLNPPLFVTQEQVTYFATPHLREFAMDRFPIFSWHGDQFIYGFPIYGEVATKIAFDYSGKFVTPETRSYEGDEGVEQALISWLSAHIPNFLGPKLYSKTCLYTMPKDRHFILDTLPEQPNILVCVGAGHAFKFASLLGKILSQLAIDGSSTYPIDAFTLQRPAITDPTYQAVFTL